MNRAASDAINVWHAHASKIATQEVNRLIYGMLVPNIDRADAEQHAIVEAWLELRKRGTVSWGFVRIVMRRRLINEYVRDRMALSSQHAGYTHEPIMGTRHGDTAHDGAYPHPEVITNPWPDVEFDIASEQIRERVREHYHDSGFALPLEVKSDYRQKEHRRRQQFATYARRLMRRRFD